MTTLFLVCALLGGTMLICQTVMTLVGLGIDHDLAGDTGAGDFGHEAGAHGDAAGSSGHELNSNESSQAAGHPNSTWFFGIVTFRTVVAALTFFGLSGMASQSSNLSSVPTLTIAVSSGAAAMVMVHVLMKQIARMRSDGSVRIDHAVGKSGTVYLKIPGHLGGAGKIQINLQNRTVELSAWTDRSEIATGATVIVTRIVGPDSVEVALCSANPGSTPELSHRA